MDMTTYIERDNEFSSDNDIPSDAIEITSLSEDDVANQIEHSRGEDVFTRRRARGAFTYFPSAVF